MEEIKHLSSDSLKQKLMKTIEEHTDLNNRVDSLSQKTLMTPEDEMELKRLRKIKLYKKDMITYLSEMVKTSES